jgi:hypothetical protein
MYLKCSKCNEKATWYYMPSGTEKDWGMCNEHIQRGCSCQLDENNQMSKDEQGRELPCCEFNYNENGFDI